MAVDFSKFDTSLTIGPMVNLSIKGPAALFIFGLILGGDAKDMAVSAFRQYIQQDKQVAVMEAQKQVAPAAAIIEAPAEQTEPVEPMAHKPAKPHEVKQFGTQTEDGK